MLLRNGISKDEENIKTSVLFIFGIYCIPMYIVNSQYFAELFLTNEILFSNITQIVQKLITKFTAQSCHGNS